MEKLETTIEALEQKRTKWLFVNLIGFCIWDGLRIYSTYFLENQSYPILTGITLLGGLVWLFSLIQMLQLVKKISNSKQINQILNDELIELNRLRAWRMAFFALLLTQGLLILSAVFMGSFSGILAAEISMFVAVVFSIGGFLYYNTLSDA